MPEKHPGLIEVATVNDPTIELKVIKVHGPGIQTPYPQDPPGSYSVSLELSRAVTDVESRASRALLDPKKMSVNGPFLTARQTTIENIRDNTAEISSIVKRIEESGKELQQLEEERELARQRREEADEAEVARRADIAAQITFG